MSPKFTEVVVLRLGLSAALNTQVLVFRPRDSLTTRGEGSSDMTAISENPLRLT